MTALMVGWEGLTMRRVLLYAGMGLAAALSCGAWLLGSTPKASPPVGGAPGPRALDPKPDDADPDFTTASRAGRDAAVTEDKPPSPAPAHLAPPPPVPSRVLPGPVPWLEQEGTAAPAPSAPGKTLSAPSKTLPGPIPDDGTTEPGTLPAES